MVALGVPFGHSYGRVAGQGAAETAASAEANNNACTTRIRPTQAPLADFFFLITTGLANLLGKPLDSHRPGQFT
jgi:hypothetical protein